MVKGPWYILGPCSAETREQTLLTARQLKEECGDLSFIYRAGVWKPRTSPYSFQGAGSEALGWLQEVKQTLGLEIATEVATPEHVEAALQAGIDYLWIGARTSANPMAVSTIAEAITNCKSLIANCPLKGILIKNPVNEDAGLWVGNIERLERSGVPVMAVHRGCGHQPCWAMAHKVQTERPDIPMLLDPSHMSGNATKVPELMVKMEELGLSGAMIEVHYRPEEALSDAKQQISPSEFGNALVPILSRYCLASLSCPPKDEKELNWLRAEIDELDDRLWESLAARMDVSRRIGEWKKAHGIAPLQPERYQHILSSRTEWAQQYGISEEFTKQLFDIIHQESLKKQQ